MSAVFTAGGSLWGSADLSRGRGGTDFEPREISLLKRLAPHLGAGLKTATLRARASFTERFGVDTPGVLTLNLGGRAVQHTAAAARWLRELADLEPGWPERAELPAPVWMVSGALRRALNPSSDRDLAAVPRLQVRARSGRWLALYASLTEPTPTRPSETLIVIDPAKPGDVALLNMAAYGLSPREEEVVTLVARGSSTRQISATLYISEYTVQNHLRNAFEKVGAGSRGELLKRIFFDGLYHEPSG